MTEKRLTDPLPGDKLFPSARMSHIDRPFDWVMLSGHSFSNKYENQDWRSLNDFTSFQKWLQKFSSILECGRGGDGIHYFILPNHQKSLLQRAPVRLSQWTRFTLFIHISAILK